MAKIENRSSRAWEITALPGKDGKAGDTYVFPAKNRETGAVGVGEIPDAVLDDLLARDAFAKGAFASGNDLVRVAAETKPAKEEKPAKDK